MGLFARTTIALTDGDTEIEINVTFDLNHSYPAKVTKYPVEKDGLKMQYSDHVITDPPGISLSGILSSSSSLLALSSTSVSDKIDTLTRWQSKGQLVTLLGYKTGGIISSLLSLLPSFFRFVEPDDPDKRYIGRALDEIPNLLLEDFNFKESAETGEDVACDFKLIPALIAKAKTRSLSTVATKGRANLKSETVGGSAPGKSSSWAKSMF